ncbi:TonB-dependent receptor [Hymenobacter sp. DH14]|uniref:TonB-dependent receptor n=1 Tax=Hymenobacter cyanobacteriorum TaxID=2926463 RepID=A0A9X1VHC5_9BACT|nr:TonB-dependent receptor [Hymenobacter cyanobacteriorum]MCI1188881.1 TonB-dependent receptor [Hymenobacter cyanobacteriorum]
MNHSYLRHFVLLALMLFTAHLGWSQGATTAAMSGVITDKTGAGLPGATVIAVHTPTNTQYVTPTNSEGRFNIQNMRVGGPYTIKVTFVGYKDLVREGVSLTLGQNLRFDQQLNDASTELTEVTVTARQNPVMNADHTGASTTVQRETIERLPTLNRSLNDFTRLTPQANGQSFGGRNSGFNNITVDGAIFNNAFGLSSTVGGQAGAQPISLDAIDQIQVSIAPFDVRQGSFTGAGINVVTRSGSNKVSASVYDFFRNQDFVGSTVNGVKSDYPKFNLNNIGFRVGGPIIKDKLFFFINAESERRNDPPTGNFTASRDGSTPGGTVSAASGRDLDVLSNFLQQQYGYNAGPYENYQLKSNSDKATIKLDWNISNNNRFNIKYNYLKSYADIAPSTSGAIGGSRFQSQFGLPFLSSYYRINNNLNSIIAELNSTLGGGKFSNNLTAGYSAFRDFRESSGGIFPLVDIGNGVGRTASGTAGITASNTLTAFGYEPFSAFNILNSDVYQFGDNFTAYLGKHNVTVGTYNEYYKFRNGFAPNYYGNYSYNSLEDFYASAGFNYDRATATYTPFAAGTVRPGAQRYNLQYSAVPGGAFPFADITAAQLGLYVQDEWSPRSNLKVTYGVRADLPFLTSDLQQNDNAAKLTFRDGVQLNTGSVPKKSVLFSPRVGFNWDVNDDRKTQLRGGTGIFTGRVPFVWLSNQASNNGVQFGSYTATGSAAILPNTTSTSMFNPNVDAYRPQNAAANTAYNLAVTASDFKFPQVWRTNLAVDQELPGGVIGTLEAFYTKDLNAIYHQNVNLPGTEANPTYRATPVGTGGDNREVFYVLNNLGAGITTPTRNYQIYAGRGGASATNPNISDAILMKNTNKGYSYAITGQLQKTFSSGFFASVAYTYSDSRSVNDGGSIAQSIWRDRSVSGDPNSDALSYSNFLQQHRFIASASYRKEYLGHLGTTLSLFYEAAPAGRYSYVYSGDMNGDNQTSNDLMYIPRSQSEINLRDITLLPAAGTAPAVIYTAADQWNDLNNFINQDDYLSKHRGDYAERNGAVRPWQNRLDFRLLQDIFTNLGNDNRNTLQISIDIFNIGNLINSKWGAFQTANKVNPLTFSGYNQQGQPVFTFPYLTNPTRTSSTDATVAGGTKLTETFRYDTGGIGSRWQGQVGIRYIFN